MLKMKIHLQNFFHGKCFSGAVLVIMICSGPLKAQPSPCDAIISFSYDVGNPFQLDFCNASEFVPGSYNYTFFWDLGDGNQSTDSCFSHLYDNSGAYTVCLTVSACDPNVGGICCSDDTCVTIYPGGKGGFGTGISNITSGNAFEIFPNPVGESTSIHYSLNEVSDVTIEIMNTAGKILCRRNKNNVQCGTHSLMLNSNLFPGAGIYILHLYTSHGVNYTSMLFRE